MEILHSGEEPIRAALQLCGLTHVISSLNFGTDRNIKSLNHCGLSLES